MKKKILSILLAVCLLLGALPMAASAAGETSGTCGDNVTWSYDTGTKTLTISGTGSMEDYPRRQPWAGLWDDIQTVVIRPGVTSIGGGAFYDCTGLTSITIPNSVTSIGEHAFRECYRLTSVNIPDSVTSIGNSAFVRCFCLTSIIIPDGVTSIGNSAFGDCTGLTSITIPNRVTSIGDYAFFRCENMASVTIPNSVTSIGWYAFDGCTGLNSINIPDGVTSIDAYAFKGCANLTDLHIPDSVTSIGWGVFEGCTGLTSITIPDSVTSIGNSAFYHCTGLTSITIPDSVTSIGRSAFCSCTGLASVTIPDSVTSIGRSAFSDCTSLTSITIPNSVTEIGYAAFGNCPNLTIYGVAGSEAEKYAKKNNIPFVAGEAPDEPVKPTKPTKPTVVGFSDVFQGEYYAEAVKWAVENGITAGTDKTHFSPKKSCTRGEAVTFLWRAEGSPEPAGDIAFTDVKSGAYYEKAVRWAVEKGVTSGTGNGKFSPNMTCDRSQIVTFLYRAENQPTVTGGNSFSDVKAGQYYENAVKWAVASGITSGTGGGKFSPGMKCDRSQIVTFLYRYSK